MTQREADRRVSSAVSDSEHKRRLREQELRIQRQIAFASGLFQEEITVRTVLESIAEGVVVVDEFGTILLVNSRAEQMFGYSRQEIIGRPHAVIIPERFRAVHEEHEAEYFKAPRVRPMGLLLDLAGCRKDGSEFPVEISLGFIETANGVFVLAFVSDITLRKQFEGRLRESDELFRAQVESVKDYAVFMLDAGGNVLNWNEGAERLKGYREDEIVGRHFSSFYPEEECVARAPEKMLRLAQEEGRSVAEGWRLRKDGSRFWAEVVITALRDEKGGLRGFSNVTHDITGRKQAEDALRSSERLFSSFMLHLPAAAWIKDLNGRYVYANAEAERIFSKSLSEVAGKSDEEVFPPEAARQFAENDRRVLAEEGSLETTEVLRQADGIDHHSIVSKFAVPGPDDKTAFVAGVAFDITERIRAEEALRFSEARYRALYDDNPTMIATLDANFTILSVNPFCANQLGYTIEELEGRSVLAIFHEEDRPAVAEQLHRCLAEPGQVHRWQFRKVHKDGGLLWVEEIAQAVHDSNGALNILVVCQDITERKRSDEALRKSELKFFKIFHSTPAIIAITTLAEGRCIDMNEVGLRTLGYSREEVVGRSTLELGIWESKSHRERLIRLLEENGAVRDFETTLRRKDGATLTALFSVEFIELDGDRYMLSMVNDITERRRMEEEIEKLNTDLAARAAELEAANRELEAFNYTVAHDLRKPLTVVNGYCQAIQELCGGQLDEKCQGYLRETYDGTWRMNRLIDALLNFSRLAHVELQRATVNLTAMAHEVALELKRAEPQRRVDFRISDGIMANGDASLLRVVLDNLLGNAWKYSGMREEAVIEFGVREIDGEPALFVRDNGAGFAMADADRLFLPFQRLPGAEKCRGFGVGLATVERIIRCHGGRVWAEGEPGKGATFYFTLAGARAI